MKINVKTNVCLTFQIIQKRICDKSSDNRIIKGQSSMIVTVNAYIQEKHKTRQIKIKVFSLSFVKLIYNSNIYSKFEKSYCNRISYFIFSNF